MRTMEHYIKKNKPLIDKRLEELLKGRIEDYEKIFEGGKRARPILCLLVFDSLTKSKDRAKAIDMGCVIEIGHSLSLAIDDVIDMDKSRRGQDPLYMLKGMSQTMVGVFSGMTVPYEILADYDPEYLKMFARAQREVCNGVIDEIVKPELPAKKLYNLIINRKTATPFAFAAKAGAMVANAPPEVTKSFENYGRYMGRAFQIADDGADLIKAKATQQKGSPITGTEKLLALGWQIDNIVGEFIKDAVRGKLDFAKGGELLEGLANRDISGFTKKQYDEEIENARKSIEKIKVRKGYENLLLELPEYYAKTMMKESGVDISA